MTNFSKKPKRKIKAMEGRRMQGVRMLRRGITQSEVARRLEVSRQSVFAWAKVDKVNKMGWRSTPLGRPAFLTQEEKYKLQRMLRKGGLRNGFDKDRWSLSMVVKLISENLWRHEYSRSQAMRLLKELGFSCEKPNIEDEVRFAKWQRLGWIDS
jgi:transposase